MSSKDLISQKGAKQPFPAKRETQHPLISLQQEMNRLFDNFFSGFDPFPGSSWERGLQAYNPRVDITDDPKALRVTVELPGMEEKDLEVTLTSEALTIKGQKKQESEDKGKNYYRMERSYGSFQRVIPLPSNVDPAKVEASFKKGLLTVTLPKTGDSRRDVRKISLKSE